MLSFLAFGAALAAPVDDLHPSFLAAEGADLVLTHTAVRAEVSAGLAVVSVEQTFANPHEEPIDATYVFPLPDDAAVRHMELHCGERVIVGEIQTREQARQTYDEARHAGRKAALLEQQRDNVFTQYVAGLCPGETVSVALEYVLQLAYEDNTYELVFPTTLGPRYAPGNLVEPPFVPSTRSGRDIEIAVTIDEGLPVQGLFSDTHDITIAEEGAWGASVELTAGDTIPNKDFQLAWVLAGEEPRASVVTDSRGDGTGYVAVTLEPQLLEDLERQRQRELLFVLDSSCSMAGEPWDTSVEAVELALDQMEFYDTFNLVKFSDAASSLFDTPQPASKANVALARQWLQGFAGGGTRMDVGIAHSLVMPGDPEALRLVLLLTDGYIGDEDFIFRTVEEHLGDSRLFALGVGSAVNRYLLENLARVGRGSVATQLPGTPIDETVADFYGRIAHPAMTDIELSWDGLYVTDQVPRKIPDLWTGQPLRVVARYSGGGEPVVRLSGLVDGEPYELQLPVDMGRADEHEGVSALWARQRIYELSFDREQSQDRRREQITELALEHHLVSAFTSLVAVEESPSRCGASGTVIDVPSELPQGMSPQMLGQAHGGSLGALGVKGRGSGASGYGSGAANFGAKGEGGIGRVGGDPIILGALDKSLIDAVIKRHMNQIRYCYQRQLRDEPKLAGKLTIQFAIAKDGSVSSAQVKSSTLGDSEAARQVGACVAERFGKFAFPEPKGGGVVIVSYPFVFSPG